MHCSLVDDNVDGNLDDHECAGDDGDALGDLEVLRGGVTTEQDCLEDQLYAEGLCLPNGANATLGKT